MQTDSHMEVVSPDRYYAYSRHTERIFRNYESPCQTRINPLLSLLHYNICYIRKKISYICYLTSCDFCVFDVIRSVHTAPINQPVKHRIEHNHDFHYHL